MSTIDPDRYDPTRDDPTRDDPTRGPTRDPTQDPVPLDPALDPDRFSSPTLPGLLGDGAQEDERDGLEWLYGLLGVIAFLGLVTAAIYLL